MVQVETVPPIVILDPCVLSCVCVGGLHICVQLTFGLEIVKVGETRNWYIQGESYSQG